MIASIALTFTLAASPLLNAAECEGNACGSVTVTYDGGRRQYLVTNTSDKKVKVSFQNGAAGFAVHVGPKGQEYVAYMQAYIKPYHADFE